MERWRDDAQGQHEVAVKHACSAGETDRLKIKAQAGDRKERRRKKRKKEKL